MNYLINHESLLNGNFIEECGIEWLCKNAWDFSKVVGRGRGVGNGRPSR